MRGLKPVCEEKLSRLCHISGFWAIASRFLIGCGVILILAKAWCRRKGVKEGVSSHKLPATKQSGQDKQQRSKETKQSATLPANSLKQRTRPNELVYNIWEISKLLETCVVKSMG